jgi:hypothetical protein
MGARATQGDGGFTHIWHEACFGLSAVFSAPAVAGFDRILPGWIGLCGLVRQPTRFISDPRMEKAISRFI